METVALPKIVTQRIELDKFWLYLKIFQMHTEEQEIEIFEKCFGKEDGNYYWLKYKVDCHKDLIKFLIKLSEKELNKILSHYRVLDAKNELEYWF
jgi:hypothetical protein